MKIEDLSRSGPLALGVGLGLAATALLGFAVGVVVTRDPQVLRRVTRRVASGLESATLMAAQAREHIGDLWAEAREEARAEVDAADFERAAAKAAPAAAPAVPTEQPARKRRPRGSAPPVKRTEKSHTAAGQA